MTTSSTKIASLIADAIKKEPNITDVHIREGSRLYYKSPKGLRVLSEDIMSKTDVMAFFTLVTSHRPQSDEWGIRIKGPKGDFNDTITIEGTTRLRVNGFIYGESRKYGAAVRCQPVRVKPMDKLGVPEIMKFYLEQKGLVLITGPTSSGKSTTLASAIDYLNTSSAGRSNYARTITTVEDPIEYEFVSDNCLITQREVGTGYLSSMSDGVISSLRQNPNVIGIGEARDKDTISTMLRAASSGHLVLASMHTNSARDTVEAILSVYEGEEIKVKAAALASRLIGIISQQLVPRADASGFILATELLTVNTQVRNAIRSMAFAEFNNLMDTSNREYSSYTLNSELASFVTDGQITKEAALIAAYDPEGLKQKLGIVGIE